MTLKSGIEMKIIHRWMILIFLSSFSNMLNLNDKVSADNIEQGRKIYSQVCFNCHGPKLNGGIGPALNDNYWRHGSSPEAILNAISKGIPETEMIAFENVYSESDRIALRDFILSEQEGMREVLRSVYPVSYFKGKRFKPELFKSVESESQKPLPENVFYFDRSKEGILLGNAKLYIKEAGNYQFVVRPIGRTSIYLNEKEVHYSDAKINKKDSVNLSFELTKGVHDIVIMHEEKVTHSYRFHAVLKNKKGLTIDLCGRSLEGNVPRIIKPGVEAKVARKWIAGLPPRTLLCVLPNKVIVAYNPVDGKVLKAWHTAEINQTPSLADRSAKASALKGIAMTEFSSGVPDSDSVQFKYYESMGEMVTIVSTINGVDKVVTIAPKGAQSFSLSIK